MQQTLSFLGQLAHHNDRAWLDAHRDQYEAARAEFADLVRRLLFGLAETDPAYGMHEPKEMIFRLHRDVRFSKDKRPYKTNFSAFFAPDGKKSRLAGHYLQIQPGGGSLLAVGCFQPPADDLRRIRQEIDYDGDALRATLDAPPFREAFGPLQGARLQRPPKGYAADHPHLELLQHKDFLAMRSLSDAQVLDPSLPDQILAAWAAARPFATFINRALTEPDA